MSAPNDEAIRAGLERRLAGVEAFIRPAPAWETDLDLGPPVPVVRVVQGRAFGTNATRRGLAPHRLVLVLTAIGVLGLVVVAAVGIGSRPSVVARPPGANGLIVYASSGDIVVTTADGSGRRLLTSGPDQDESPSWSPDGRSLAFLRAPASRPGSPVASSISCDMNYPGGIGGAARCASLMIINADGTGLRTIAADLAVAFVSGPPTAELDPWLAWSPDGRTIALAVERPGGSLLERGGEMLLVDAAGGGSRAFQPGDLRIVIAPAWSPDARRLAFIAECGIGCPTSTRDVYVADLDGSGLVDLSLAIGPDPESIPPGWTPDGTHLIVAFSSTTDPASDHDIMSLAVDGSAAITLAHMDRDETDPVVSPDGRRLAFVLGPPIVNGYVATDVRPRVAIMDLTPDATWASLFETKAGALPVWSPDGHRLLGLGFSTGDNEQLLVADTGGSGSSRAVALGTYPIDEPQSFGWQWLPATTP